MHRKFKYLYQWQHWWLWWKTVFFGVFMMLGAGAHAGHLFTQATSNTPIVLNAGQQITVKQLTYEGGGNAGRVSINFSGGGADTAWSAGDAIRISIGTWSNTFSYDTLAGAGGTQNASMFSITDATLTAAGITPNGQIDWVVSATSGKFTFEGYRIYVGAATFNGTGAAHIDQTQVVSSSGNGFAPIAATPEVGIAKVLDNLTGNVSGQMQAVIVALQAMDVNSQRLAMKLMSPERSQAVGQSAVNTASSAIDTVQVRLDSLRSGIGMQSSLDYDKAYASNDQGGEEGMAAGNASLKRSIWAKAFGGKASMDAKAGYAGSDSDIYGMMYGLDKELDSGWLVGTSVAYARTNTALSDYRDGDQAKVDTYQLTGYFGRTFERWYLEGMMAYAYQEYKTTRNTHLTGTATGNFNGDLLATRLTVGMPIAMVRGMTVTPFAGIDAYHVTQSSYTESGAGVLSLNVSGNAADRVRSIVGAELAALRKLNDGSLLRPALKLNWRHEFRVDGVNTNASLVGGGGQFEATGQQINRNVYGMIGRLSWEKTERLSFGVELGVERGSGYRSVMGQLHGNWRY